MSGGETAFRDCVNDIIVREYELMKLFVKAVGLATRKDEMLELTSLANNISKHLLGLQDDLEKRVDNNANQTTPLAQKTFANSAAKNEVPKEVVIPSVPGSSNQPTQTGQGAPKVPPNVPLQSYKPAPTDGAVTQGSVGTNKELDEFKVFIPDIEGLGRLQLAGYFAKFGNVEEVHVTMDKKPPSAVVCFLFPGTVRMVLENPFHTIGSDKIFTKPFKNRLSKQNVAPLPKQNVAFQPARDVAVPPTRDAALQPTRNMALESSQASSGMPQMNLLDRYQVYCGGTPPHATADDIKNALQANAKGLIRDVMPMDKFAFVDYERVDDARNIIAQQFTSILGKKVECKPNTRVVSRRNNPVKTNKNSADSFPDVPVDPEMLNRLNELQSGLLAMKFSSGPQPRN